MDRNTVIGMLLMGVVIFGFMWLNQPSAEELEQRRQQAIAQAAEAQEKAQEIISAAVADTIADSEIEALKQTIRQFGAPASDDGATTAYTLKNATTQITLDGETLAGSVTLSDGVTADIAEALAKTTDNVILHNNAVAALRRAANDFARNGNFARHMAGADTTVTLENEALLVEISSKGGAITRAVLKQYKAYNADQVELFNKATGDYSFVLNTYAQRFDTGEFFFTPHMEGDTAVTMTLDLGDGATWGVRYVLPEGRYDVRMDVLQQNMDRIIPGNIPTMDLVWSLTMARHEAGKMFEERYSGLFYKYAGGDVDNLSESKKSRKDVTDRMKWFGFKDQFFSSVLICQTSFVGAQMSSEPIDKDAAEYAAYMKRMSVTTSLDYSSSNPAPASFNFFFGPNKYSLLSSYDDLVSPDEDLKLTKMIPLGWAIFRWINTGIIIPIFNLLGNFVGNYGIVILIMTLIIKLVLWPLMHKTYKSQAKMRFLAPDIKAINEKYPGKDNAMTRQQKTMALYNQAGASPFSGCLPMLLQMPILFAMFTFFPSCIDLRGQSFLWVKDLSAPDAIISWNAQIPFITNYFGNHISLFCVLMTVTNILYTRITMQSQSGSDQMASMKWMMYLLPIMFLVFFNNYAAGLSYYYFLSLLITILQNFGYRHFVSEKKMREKMAINAKKPKKKSGFMARMEEMQRQQKAMLEEQNRRKNNGKGR